MACNFTLDDLKGLPSFGKHHLSLTDPSTDCDEICSQVYGNSNPDLTGSGMIVFYVIHLFLSILFGPVLILYSFSPSARRRRSSDKVHGESRFTKWLKLCQELFFYAQLWYILATSTACFIRQVQQITMVYESAVTAGVVSLGFVNLFITLSAFNHPLQQKVLVAITIASVVPFCIYSVFKHHQQIIRFGPVLHICSHLYGAATPSTHHYFHRDSATPAVLALTSILAIFGGFSSWMRHDKEKANDLLGSWYGKTLWGLRTAILFVSIISTGLSVLILVTLMRIRATMAQMHGNKSDENAWGIGQIGAVFAWAPVLFGMAYYFIKLWFPDNDQTENQPANQPAHHQDIP